MTATDQINALIFGETESFLYLLAIQSAKVTVARITASTGGVLWTYTFLPTGPTAIGSQALALGNFGTTQTLVAVNGLSSSTTYMQYAVFQISAGTVTSTVLYTDTTTKSVDMMGAYVSSSTSILVVLTGTYATLGSQTILATLNLSPSPPTISYQVALPKLVSSYNSLAKFVSASLFYIIGYGPTFYTNNAATPTFFSITPTHIEVVIYSSDSTQGCYTNPTTLATSVSLSVNLAAFTAQTVTSSYPLVTLAGITFSSVTFATTDINDIVTSAIPNTDGLCTYSPPLSASLYTITPVI